MIKRSAYAISDDDYSAYKFESRELRDLVVEMIDDIESCTYATWRTIERKDSTLHQMRDDWGDRLDTQYSACDMSIYEYWDGEWWPVYERACELGIL